jgi:hypothetical protein
MDLDMQAKANVLYAADKKYNLNQEILSFKFKKE